MSIQARLPTITFLHSARDLLPICYNLADTLCEFDAGNSHPSPPIRITFRDPLTDMLSTLTMPYQWELGDPLDPTFSETIIPGTEAQTVSSFIQQLEACVSKQLGPGYLGEIATLLLKDTFFIGTELRYLFFDATNPLWIQKIASALDLSYLTIHLYAKTHTPVEEKELKQIPGRILPIYISEPDPNATPNPIHEILTQIDREL